MKYPALRERYEQALATQTQRVEYSDALADKICEKIANSKYGLHEVIKGLNIGVHITTVFRWLKKHPYFKEEYQLAKEVQADLLIEQILHIADDSASNVPIAYLKVQIAARQWIAGRLNPRQWDPKYKGAYRPSYYDRDYFKEPEWLNQEMGRERQAC